MKSRIPQDVERLMWIVAESSDPKAIADFESRFPEFVPELAKRRRMVTDLKGAKTVQPTETRIPAFHLRNTQSNAVPKGMWVMGGVALAALSVAAYSVTVMLNHKPPVLPKVGTVTTTPVVPPPTTVFVPPKQPTQTQSTPPPFQNPTSNQPPVNNQDQPKTLKLSNTSLLAALKMVGEMAGYRVDIAPGFEDQQVSIDYVQTSTSEMLKDLGMRYGFTAFDQGDGSIIIVPAIDGGNPIGDPGNDPPRKIGG